MTYQVHIVRYGTHTTRRSGVYLDHAVYGEPDADIVLDYSFWILRSRDRTVLVDCGFSAEAGAARGRETLIEPAAALARLGIAPEEIDTLVLTHAHYDHIGNPDLAPRAAVWIAARELAFWRSPTARRPLFDHLVEDADLDRLRAIAGEGRLRVFSGAAEPAPGVAVTVVGGHTPGQSIVECTTTAGPVLLASDCAHFEEEVDRRMPFHALVDLPAMYAGYDHVARRVAETGAILVTGHDPAVLPRHRRGDALGEFAGVIGEAARKP